MAVADEFSRPSPTAPEYDRQPPQDVAAEQSVLGGMLLSKDAIADVVEVLHGNDFYRPAHQVIFDCILDLYGRGEPADAITVAAELNRTDQLSKMGGAVYLHTLIQSTPTAANAGYYAAIVAEQAVLRRLVEAGTRVVQLGYGAAGGRGDVDDIVDRAQQEIYDVTEKRMSEDYARLEDVLQPTMDELDAIASRGGTARGVPTGIRDLDELTNGLQAGQMVVIAARPGVGKALALDTLIATPTGWTTMGEVAVGDRVMGSDGRPTTVVAATEVMTGRPCYEVHFSDGSVIVADAQHQWLTEDMIGRAAPAAVRTTEEIARTVRAEGSGSPSHAVSTAAPLVLSEARLALPPYAVGVELGAPSAAERAELDPEIAMYVHGEAAGRPDASALTAVGRAARIPAEYLRASIAQRRALLAGLLDAGGTVSDSGAVQFVVPDPDLRSDVRELIGSLGHRVQDVDDEALAFVTDEEVFWLQRKKLAHKEQATDGPRGRDVRFITDVRAIASVPVRCIQVDAEDHLFLAGRSFIPTHNSTLGLDIARSATVKHQLATCIFSLEMSKHEITMRLLSAEAKVPLHHMRAGTLSDEDWSKLARRMGEIADAPLYIDDSPNMTMMEIRAKARRLKQRNDLKLVVIDYLQLMTSGKRVESRQQEVSEFSRALKLLAKELEVPVIAMSQLNRGSEQRQDKKPMLSDLRESGSIEQDADMVMMIHREDMYEKESPRAGEADIMLVKHRNGPTANVTVAFQGHYSRFVDMAN
ncbi:replicative DNA helicase [Geodermatophilus sp. DF01-2]|uniref:replicative DNA helicase n=1 Tax=Geodermatophilus sp. DF01-2 TaxID=2559610 RepID=UPI0010743DAE|nr:replicative DNA helicase [Geodermatophilus sp. DF01_2]TFV57286.1 replicative DNA helicase [Geodermatophilus sp. DF01_2]